MSEPGAIRLTVTGRVQGVGFRPGVYRLARELDLAGSVRNTPRGVEIELEGTVEALADFERRLPEVGAPLARIRSLQRQALEPAGRGEFSILPSASGEGAGALIPYDVATCDACLRELLDPADRRHRYPFINCTLCGPRYTIIESLPYDRPRTSMRVFPLCPACQAEYDDPAERRHHAQPNACPICGPRLSLVDPAGASLAGEPLATARQWLRDGRILAVRGLGGFHLACDATRPAAVETLRERKRRGPKPFAVMVPDLAAARRLAVVDELEAGLLLSDRRPIVLLDRRPDGALAAAVAPDNPRLGILLPYTGLHHLLLEGFAALVMTSGNLAEEPIAKDNQEALTRLAGLADAFLLHDRDILMSCDDSVAYTSGGQEILVRRSRGFAPDPVELPGAPAGILAVGAQMKNTFCLTRRGEAFLSQHIGDLENLETEEHFRRCLAHLGELLGQAPRWVVCDRHPDYPSTRLAEEIGVPCVRVQHHHAHLAACLADAGRLDDEVIGLCLDGTGLGDDGTIWGGEALVGGVRSVQRAAHLRPFRLPGGDAAVHEPWRAALALLSEALGPAPAAEQLARLVDLDSAPLAAVSAAIERGINAPWTTSMGRLFDAVSALLSLGSRVQYDGQAAVALEASAGERPAAALPLPLAKRGQGLEIDHRPLVHGLLERLRAGAEVAELAAGFHEAVADALVAVCQALRQRGAPARVALSGGCWVNRRLYAGVRRRLQQAGFEMIVHRQVPANDGGLCLGQAAVAVARLGEERV